MSWADTLARRLGAPVTVLARRPLAGGYVARSVERVELDVGGQERTVVLKRSGPVEVAAMRALAVVRGIRRGQALAIGPDWLVLPFVDGPPLTTADPVPDEIWEVLARVHAHCWGRRPRGLPVVDAGWWRGLVDRTLAAVRGGAERSGAPEYRAAAAALAGWRDDPVLAAALAVLPRTLTHSDPHRGNVLVDPNGPVLIDWGNARVAPGGVDVAVPTAEGDCSSQAYDRVFAQLAGPVDRLRAIEEPWARLHVHVQYLGFAADHLGPGRVAEMIDAAAQAHARLRTAL
ncbi:MAG: aminoglycoside phosphotransferase family protein, partial [Pseudonocardia sp.]|nr:aminoglycoside phosphotransferase family protein [Pseudonocardia sp.]